MISDRIRRIIGGVQAELRASAEVRELLIHQAWGLYPDRTTNPLTARPRRHWSQSDEDGIIAAIFARIGSETDGRFMEFGVGDGRENNTLALLARGWSGAWIGNEDLAFRPIEGGRLAFLRAWIDRDNVVSLAEAALSAMGGETLDLVSFDLDGNDYHLVRLLLEAGLRPAVWVCEYNARFPVGARWVMPYSKDHAWSGDDYFGASISSLVDLLGQFDYSPVACSAQGANLFAIRNNLRPHFEDVPENLEDLYQPPFYELPRKWAHPPSPLSLRLLTSPRQDSNGARPRSPT